VNVNLGNGTASGAGSDSITQVENATGTPFGDHLIGSGAANVLKGLGGNDALKGLAGNDRLLGGPGHDKGNGGPGNDTCKSIEVPTSC
jgi:Ca2+-binding RTX toxin-like protein